MTLQRWASKLDRMRIRSATPEDRSDWHSLRCQLWPEDDSGHAAEIEAYFCGERPDLGIMLLAECTSKAVGFAEIAIRPFAEGCSTRNVGYLEGWYVQPSHRGQGIGRALLSAAEE